MPSDMIEAMLATIRSYLEQSKDARLDLRRPMIESSCSECGQRRLVPDPVVIISVQCQMK